ncbi:MAG: sulfotransferase domain-containing protein [Bacteroidia bacterium]|nr:sulfotransferase domain-containing protein [Bacteroidia bacterium]
MSRPNFFIVGAPKCGTTAMNNYLSQHPEIFMAPKEIHYFGEDLKIKVKISESEYLKNFQDTGNSKIIGDASVWYLFSKTAAGEIKKFSPEAKILIMLRNPVEVIHSLHSQHLYDGNEDVVDFEKAISLDDERKRGLNLADSVDFFETPTYKESVFFSEQVKRYLNEFTKKNVHLILYEDFKKDPKKEFTETLKFLGVNADSTIEYKVVNPNRQIQSFYLHRLIKKPSGNLKRAARIFLPSRKFRHLIMTNLLKWNIKVKERKKINARLDRELKEYLSGDINLLSKIIERDLSGWLQ